MLLILDILSCQVAVGTITFHPSPLPVDSFITKFADMAKSSWNGQKIEPVVNFHIDFE